MKVSEAVHKLEKSSEFRKWKKSNSDSYLADAFIILDANEQQKWQLGYYSEKDDRITVFKLESPIEVSKPEEIMKKGHDKIIKVVIGDVKVEMGEALKKSAEFLRKNFPKDTALKTIVILQNIEKSIIWNITHITSAYNAINVRVNAANGKILSHKSIPIFEFQKKDKK